MMGFGWIVVLLAVALLVLGVLFPLGRQAPPAQAVTETPLEIAKRRYTRAEISEDEFESIKRGLA